MPTNPASRRPALGEMKAHAADAAELLKALGNEQRLLVLCSLAEGPLTVGELNRRVPLSQSALSQHLAKLREAGLVEQVVQHRHGQYRATRTEQPEAEPDRERAGECGDHARRSARRGAAGGAQ